MAGKKSIRNALMAQYVMVAAIPLLMITVMSLRLLINHTNNDLTTKNTQLARSISASIDEFLHQASDEMAHTAAVLSKDGRIVSPGTEDRYLQSLIDANLYFEMICLVDEQGLVQSVAPFKRSEIGVDLSSNQFLSRIRHSSKVQWSDTYISTVTGEPTVTLGLRLNKRAIIANLNLARISSFAQKFTVGKSGHVEIVDKNGTYIAHPDPTKVAQREVDTTLNKEIAAKTGSLGFSYKDSKNLYNAVRLREKGWSVIAVEPIQEAYQPLLTIRNTSTAVILLAVALALIVSVRNATFLSRHLLQLVKRTQAVAAGDYSEVVSPSRINELCELTCNFNSMTTEIHNLVADLEEAEAAKTRFYRETILSVTNGKLEVCEEAEVAEYVESPVSAEITTASAAALARKIVNDLCISHGFDQDRTDEFVLGVGEAIANAIKHGEAGRISCGFKESAVWVAVIDKGPGLESIILPKAVLKCGFSTKPSMGMGYSIMLEVADRLLLCTGKEGTTIVLFKQIVEPEIVPIENFPDIW